MDRELHNCTVVELCEIIARQKQQIADLVQRIEDITGTPMRRHCGDIGPSGHCLLPFGHAGKHEVAS